MEKIVMLLLSFLGICTGFAQNPAGNDTSQMVATSIAAQKAGHDSLIVKETASVKLFPNPAKNKVELEVKGFEPGMVQLQLISAAGKIVRNDSRLLFSGNENLVVMFSLTPGIYFILLKQNNKLVKKKMLVQ
jgi:hypothetical protein